MSSNGGCLGCTGRALSTVDGPYWGFAKRRSFAVMLRDSAFSMGRVRFSCGQMGNRLGRCQLLFVGKKNLSAEGKGQTTLLFLLCVAPQGLREPDGDT